jgi:hypothetical protein
MDHPVIRQRSSKVGVLRPLRRCVAGLAGLALIGVLGGCEGRSVASPGIAPDAPAAAPLGKRGCRPDCRGKVCGTDGCGGHCGKCAKGRLCLADRCVRTTLRELCRLVTGRWKGVMRAQPLHHLDGRIFRQGKVCRGRFKISYNLPRKGSAWVVQEFVITFTGTQMRMRGVRLSSNSSNSNYNLDRFAGNLNKKLTRYSGYNRDVRGSTSSFYLNKK